MRPIRLRGARTHNLKGVDLVLHPGELVAVTGPSGAGKSSLALDTLYAEGQRRFVESFSPYARQFLERLERPPIDELAPVAATVAVDRRAPVKSSRSTLATMADLEPYLAGIFGREAIPTCPTCGIDAVDTSPRDAADRLAASHDGARALVTYAVPLADAEQFLEVREQLAKSGYRRLIVGGALREIDEVRPSEATSPGVVVEVVVDRVTIRRGEARRLQEAIETAWTRGHGRAELRVEEAARASTESSREGGHVSVRRGLVCPSCARRFEPPRPGLFSYNSPFGACDACRGFGRIIAVDWGKVIPDPRKSLKLGAIKPWSGASTSWERGILAKFCARQKIPLDVPWEKLEEGDRARVLDGEGTWHKGKYPGVRAWFGWLETRTYKMHVRVLLSRYREYSVCVSCTGSRLNHTALAYRVGGLNLASWHSLTVSDALARLRSFGPRDPQGKRVKEQLECRLGYLDAVGIGYLTLDRQARTLSGGEAQRAGLTTALGAALTGTLFVLDEPTVGLHAADVPALSRVLRDLARSGNSVLVVEHEPLVVRSCDRVIEMGPRAGQDGGRVLFDGPPAALAERLDLPTGRAWSEPPVVACGARRRAITWLELRGAREHNLRGVDVRVPLGVLCAVTGPSGSGKSTLAHDVLYRAAARSLGNFAVPQPGAHDGLFGLDPLKRAVIVDQSPLGRTARGNPATYVKAWDRIRARFAAEPDSTRRGLTAAHFSFNVAAGRCEECAGEGYETVEMQFLADVQLLCPVCRGRRFKPEVLAVTHAGRTIADVLAMSIDQALSLFDPNDARDYVLRRTLDPVVNVGLGYLPLGQPLSTLSGGEAQRLKLARALSENAEGTLFVVDEPSAGLHAQDAAYVVRALRRLVDDGASVVVVEHDLDVIRACDWVIDLGPGGGPNGGQLAAEGTPEQVAESATRTGQALRDARASTRVASREEALASAARAAPMSSGGIVVSHAREHNLKDVSCTIPHGKICVVTGPSGSGKSSLAFDVVFAEGQRRFMETLTPYARQFLPTLPRPDVDSVTGVPPSIALEQRTSRGGANSTVATVTEVAHYLRLLYAKVGELHCPECDEVVVPMSADGVFETLVTRRHTNATKHTLYAPAVRARKGTYLDLFTNASRAGVRAARIDGAIVAIEPPPKLAKSKEHTIDLIVYFGKLADLDRPTFDRALGWGAGAVRVAEGPPRAAPVGGEPAGEPILSTARSCPTCGTGVPELDPRWFSFNTKQGQCEACEGTGVDGGPATIEGYDPPYDRCSTCGGSRLSAVPRGVRMFGESYAQLTSRSVASALDSVERWSFGARDAAIAKAAHAELLRRLAFVQQVGLGYLSLDRPAHSLSGGEMQRLRLSAQLGSGLTGALYVLDEPTIGLHPRDTNRLLSNLRQLADMGSTVVVVEHDADTIRAADHVIDLGPGGGRNGGHVVAEGPAADVLADPRSPTARALAETARAPRPKRPMADAWIELGGARANNLQNVDFRVPVGRMCVVAGVSGSGKSTLVRHVFYPALRRALGLVSAEPGAHATLKGHKSVKRALAVDQSPIGRTPRSVPATFLGIWDDMRKLFASLPEAKMRGYTAARFSFNTPSSKAGKAGGGRCPGCEGQGIIVAEMPFLPDVVAPCEACGGSRFEPSTLEVRFAGLSIGDVLHLPAGDAANVFANHKRIARPLATLADLGVGYVQIGQGSNTLSGGEAQRLKLAAELTAGSAHEPTVYVLDEPTTGLHLSDVRRLIGVLERLVARGDTLVIIEHHPDVIASADWVVELGPEAGDEGGRIVFEGEPRRLARARTATGKALAVAPSARVPLLSA